MYNREEKEKSTSRTLPTVEILKKERERDKIYLLTC